MRELIIGPNEENQRLDRFVAKYLDLAPKGFINKMIRKKNIELNGKKSDNSEILKFNYFYLKIQSRNSKQ